MKRKYISVYIFIVLSLLVISAYSQNPKRPGGVSDQAWARFEQKYKNRTPDSMVISIMNNDAWRLAESRVFTYDNRHHTTSANVSVFGDNGAWEFRERKVFDYDQGTGRLLKEEVQARLRDTMATHTRNLTRYDEKGNLIYTGKLERDQKGFYLDDGDSNVFHYNTLGTPVVYTAYTFNVFEHGWELKNEYVVDTTDHDGRPVTITMATAGKKGVKIPLLRYHDFKWTGSLKSFADIDTVTKEYVLAQYDNGRWVDSLKKISYVSKSRQIDSTVVYQITKGGLVPYRKKEYAYDDLIGCSLELEYMYFEDHWILRSGKKVTATILSNPLSVELIQQNYTLGIGMKGEWTDAVKIAFY